jgi:hypothetical protein
MKVQLLKMVHSLCDRSGENECTKALFVLPATLREEPLPFFSIEPKARQHEESVAEGFVHKPLGAEEMSVSASKSGAQNLDRSGSEAADVDADVASDAVASVERLGTNTHFVALERVLPHEWNDFGNGEMDGLVEEEEVSGKEEEKSSTMSDKSAGNLLRSPGEGQSSGEASTSGSGVDEGLMAKIIRTLMKQTSASSFR